MCKKLLKSQNFKLREQPPCSTLGAVEKWKITDTHHSQRTQVKLRKRLQKDFKSPTTSKDSKKGRGGTQASHQAFCSSRSLANLDDSEPTSGSRFLLSTLCPSPSLRRLRARVEAAAIAP